MLVKCWNVSDGRELLALTRKSSCLSIAWNPTGDKIGVGQKDGFVELINTDKGNTKVTYQTEGISQSRALHFNRSGNKLAVAGAGISQNGKGIKIISISNSSNGDQNATVLYWLKGSSPWLQNDANFGLSNFHEVDWSFDGKLIAATGTEFTFTIWDAVSGLPKHRSPVQHANQNNSANPPSPARFRLSFRLRLLLHWKHSSLPAGQGDRTTPDAQID